MEKINLETPERRNAVSMIMKQIDKAQEGRGAIAYDQLRELMTEWVDKACDFYIDCECFPPELRNEEVRKAFIRDMCRKYVSDRGVMLVEGEMLSEPANAPWVAKAMATGRLEFSSYKRYEVDVLRSRNLSKASIENMDKVTSSILDGMGDPAKPGHTAGLLMGDVQAGKTLTYTGICHKAADAGYRFIIVLTGTTNTLRVQTQNRLNADLVGQVTDSKGCQRLTRDGKSIFDWNQLTTSAFDFTVAKVDSQIAIDNPKLVTLAVTKKNARVLEHLLDWLENARGLGVHHLPMLLVDDEADNASVNSKKEDEDPTKINAQIRRILSFFDKTAYLAVTATPFANVFINPQIDSTGKMVLEEDETMDLFPRDYIYTLPPPKGYLGVERLFGEQGEIEENSLKYGALIPMRLEDETDTKTEVEARKVYEGKIQKPGDVKALPRSLIKAVLYFCCVCTLKDMTETVCTTNTSMLVHIARFTRVQNRLADMIEELLEQVQNLSEVWAADAVEDLRTDSNWQTLESLWNDGCGNELWYDDPTHGTRPMTCRELSGCEWRDVWKKRFGDTIRKIRVVTVNSEAKVKNMASYYEKNDARLIAVGGDALSRGLTLEGLCVSYFSRRSPAYDTLLQMGRWFGYRESVKDFMKIWISDCLISSYEYIAEALGEFRETLEEMRRRKRRPSDFGLRIRCAPASARLMITAPNKRRSVKRVNVWMNLAGKDFQAATFPAEAFERRENLSKISSFLKSLGDWQRGSEAFPGSSGGNDLVWKAVPADKVAGIVRELQVPSWSDGLDPVVAAKRIEARGEEWLVRVISLDEARTDRQAEDALGLGENGQVICSGRTLRKFSSWIQETSKGIRSSGHFMRHWNKKKIEEVRSSIKTLDKRNAVIYPNRVLMEPGEPPQLLVYPIRALKPEERKLKRMRGEPFTSDEVLATIAFGLPCDDRFSGSDPVQVQYDANVVWQMLHEEGYDKDEE